MTTTSPEACTDLELANENCRRLQKLLDRYWASRGRTLHAKLTSVETQLPKHLVRRMRFVATVHNRLRRDRTYTSLDDRTGFLEACRLAEREMIRLNVGQAPDSSVTRAQVRRLNPNPTKRGVTKLPARAANIVATLCGPLPRPQGPCITDGCPTSSLWLLVLHWVRFLLGIAFAIGVLSVAMGGSLYFVAVTTTAAAVGIGALAIAIVHLLKAAVLMALVAGGAVVIARIFARRRR